MTLHQIAQRTDEWKALRCGRVTGTMAKDVLAQIKSGEAAARRDARMKLVAEWLTGQPQEDDYVNAAMQRGTDLEPMALQAYEVLTGNLARPIGFITEGDHLGCSPDGLIGDDGLLELKCPKSATHIRYLREGRMPPEHLPQIIHNLMVSGRAYCDFLSFDDRLGDGLDTFLVRVTKAEIAASMADYAVAVSKFLDEARAELDTVKTLRRPHAISTR